MRTLCENWPVFRSRYSCMLLSIQTVGTHVSSEVGELLLHDLHHLLLVVGVGVAQESGGTHDGVQAVCCGAVFVCVIIQQVFLLLNVVLLLVVARFLGVDRLCCLRVQGHLLDALQGIKNSFDKLSLQVYALLQRNFTCIPLALASLLISSATRAYSPSRFSSEPRPRVNPLSPKTFSFAVPNSLCFLIAE